MRNDEHCHLTLQTVDRLHNRRLCLRIQCRRRLVEHQHLRLAVQSSRNSDSLTLSAGQTHTRLTDHRVKPLLERLHKFIELCLAQCCPDILVVDSFFFSKCNIVADRIIQHVDRLRNIADLIVPSAVRCADIDTVQCNLSLLRL